MKNKYIKNILIVLLLLSLDQLTKVFVSIFIDINEMITIIPNFLSITHITNTGAALGLLSNNTILLIFISIILICYIIKEIKDAEKKKSTLYSLLLILGGALGNIIDRVFRGFVIDFVSFKICGQVMPIFNAADIFITFGVIFLIISTIKEEKHANKKRRSK